MNGALRTAVQDRRRLVRGDVAILLAAEPSVCSVMCVATLEELSGAVARRELDVMILNTRDDPPQAWSLASLRQHRLTDATSASCLVAAICGHKGPARPATCESMNTIEGCGILTQRETEIPSRIADGMSSLQVATSLGISHRAVQNYKRRIAKLDVQSQSHAVAMTLASGDLSAMADLGRSAR